MMFRTYIPQSPLSDFVNLFWFYEGYDPPHVKERVLPTGTMELVIDLRNDELRVYDRQDTERFQSFRGPLICGAHSEFFVIDTASQASILGVHFKPGGAFPFFELPAGELRDTHASLETLWGATAGELRDRLLEAGTPEAKFRFLERCLIAWAARPLARHPAVAFALNEFQGASPPRTVASVTERIGLSPRRFIQVFREEVGLTPKLFCRIRRFQEVLGLIGRGQHVEWAEVALACGYFDQAHFIHDFRAFSGLNPMAYLAHRGEHLNHVPLCD
jgi:methylphosphotriester-DNA--protein-cysteine methyltransferase